MTQINAGRRIAFCLILLLVCFAAACGRDDPNTSVPATAETVDQKPQSEQKDPVPAPVPAQTPVPVQTRAPAPAPTPASANKALPVPPPPDPAEDTKTFLANVKSYLKIQKKAAGSVSSVGKKEPDSAVLEAHQMQLGEAIRMLRPDAKPGDVFTPGIQQLIVSTVQAKLSGKEDKPARDTVLGEGNPRAKDEGVAVNLKVNATYPTKAPLSSVPPSLLTALPTLPKEVEYRFVGRNLILRDTKANLIVDIIPNAF